MTGAVASLPATVEMKPELCIWLMTFTDGTKDITFDITKLTVSFAAYDEYEVVSAKNTFPFYVAMYPNDDVTVTVTAETPDGTYTASKSGVTFEVGKLYTSYNIALTKNP